MQATCATRAGASRAAHFHAFLHELQLSGDYSLFNNIGRGFNSYPQTT